MAGGSFAASSVDDARVKSGEKVWRLVHTDWYQSDPNMPGSPREVQEQAFRQDVSVLRERLVSQTIVDSVLGGQFVKWGILELNADDIRAEGCVFEIEVLPEWHPEGHFLLRRPGQNNKLQRLNNTQKHALVVLANAKPLLRPPQP
jgi:hypothetical protein